MDEFEQNNNAAPVTPTTFNTKSQKSRIVALILCFFLGGIGAHRFYAGKVGSAVVMLVLSIIGTILAFIGIGFFIYFAVAIWILIDFLTILFGGFKDSFGLVI